MRVFLLRKRHIALALGVLLTAAVFCAVHAPAAITTAAAQRQLPIYCVDRDDNLVSISFDAAWGDVRVRQSQLRPHGPAPLFTPDAAKGAAGTPLSHRPLSAVGFDAYCTATAEAERFTRNVPPLLFIFPDSV